jgi:adenine-specific DNA-methyltransferase
MAKKYDHLSREDLIALHQKRDASRKLGLVWERDEIEHEAALNDDFVALDLDESLSVGDGPHQNLIIEGDNFDALRYLNIAYKGRVKCIYIDPPYNTGNKDFIYNDHYVDKEDRYRQSKWLEFMYRRLTIARDLLRQDGVIMISIDDQNRARLDLMAEQVFPGCRLGSFIWKTRSGSNDEAGGRFSVDHEHVLVYANPGFKFRGEEKDFAQYKNPDKDKRGRWKTGDLSKGHTYLERPNAYYPIQNPKNGVWYPCNPSRVWTYASERIVDNIESLQAKTMEQYIREGKVIFPESDQEKIVVWETKEELLEAIRKGDVPLRPKNKTPLLTEVLPDLDFWVGKPVGFGRPWFKRHLADVKSDLRPVSSWIRGASDDSDDDGMLVQLMAQRSGTGEHSVNEILGFNAFNFPKPPSLILNILRQATDPGDIILDFFAGSGTTAHAVLLLNEEDPDEAPRQFILVSNSEATSKSPERNLCRDVCAARVRAVILGYKGTPGLKGHFAYLRAARIPIERLHMAIRHDQVWTALQQLHAGVVTPYLKTDLHVLDIADTDLYYVSKMSKSVLDTLSARAKKKKPAVVFSWQPGLLTQRIASEHIAFEKIPEFLVDRFGGQQ